MNPKCCPVKKVRVAGIVTYRVDEVVRENPKVNADVEKNEPDYGSHDCCTDLNSR